MSVWEVGNLSNTMVLFVKEGDQLLKRDGVWCVRGKNILEQFSGSKKPTMVKTSVWIPTIKNPVAPCQYLLLWKLELPYERSGIITKSGRCDVPVQQSVVRDDVPIDNTVSVLRSNPRTNWVCLVKTFLYAQRITSDLRRSITSSTRLFTQIESTHTERVPATMPNQLPYVNLFFFVIIACWKEK